MENTFYDNNRLLTIVGISVSLGLSLYSLIKPSGILVDSRIFLAVGIIWLGFFPGFIYIFSKSSDRIPFIPMVGLFYSLCFGLPSLLNLIGLIYLPIEINRFALILVNAGLIFFYISFYFSKWIFKEKIHPIKLTDIYSLSRLRLLLWILIFARLIFVIFPFFKKIPSISLFVNPAGIFSLGMLYLLYREDKIPRYQVYILFIIVLPVEISSRFSSGSLAPIMYLGLFVTCIMLFDKKKVPITLTVFIIIFFVLLQPVKSIYRSYIWNEGTENNRNYLDKSKLFFNLAGDFYSNKSDFKPTIFFSPALGRISHIHLLSLVVESTPEVIPYWNGETYKPLYSKFIPRILWPNKPTEVTGSRFGRRYKITSTEDFSTSVNLPWIVEMYANFGVFGVMIGMTIVGIILSILDNLFNMSNPSPLNYVFGLTILLSLVFQESNFSLMIGSVFYLSICLFAYLHIGLKLKRTISL